MTLNNDVATLRAQVRAWHEEQTRLEALARRAYL